MSTKISRQEGVVVPEFSSLHRALATRREIKASGKGGGPFVMGDPIYDLAMLVFTGGALVVGVLQLAWTIIKRKRGGC